MCTADLLRVTEHIRRSAAPAKHAEQRKLNSQSQEPSCAADGTGMQAGTHVGTCSRADPLMQVALSVFNSEWSAVTLVSNDRQMYVANAKGTKVPFNCNPAQRERLQQLWFCDSFQVLRQLSGREGT